jgi:hypothetical protein
MKRIVLASLMSVGLLSPGRVPAEQTNTFDSVKASHDTALLEVGQACAQREKDALKQYGTVLEGLLFSLKQKGDLDAYVVVEAEKKRFAAEGTVPDANKDAIPALADAAGASQRALSAIDSDRNRQTAALLRKYAAALDGIIKPLMKAGKIDEAKAVKVEKDKAAAELADLEARRPPEEATPDTGEAASTGKPKSLPAWLKKGLVLYYSFDSSAGGNVTDKSGKSHAGKAHGAKWTAQGKVGGAYAFDGRAAYIDAGNSPAYDFDSSRDWTFAFWVRPRGHLASMCFYSRAGENHSLSGGENYLYYQAANGPWPEGLSWGPINEEWDTGVTLSLDQWQHVVMIYDAATRRASACVNGVEKAGVQVGSVGSSTGSLRIGDNANVNFLNGAVDEVMIFDRALTEREVKQLYDAQK